MFNQNDFLAYLGMNDNNGGKKPTQQRGPRKQAPKPVTRPLPAVSATFVSPGGMLTAQPVAAVIPVKDAAPAPMVATIAAVPANPGKDIELVPYSDKSFAIFGNTRPLQSQLESLGGKFNRWLSRDGVKTPGYIFSNGRLDNVRAALKL